MLVPREGVELTTLGFKEGGPVAVWRKLRLSAEAAVPVHAPAPGAAPSASGAMAYLTSWKAQRGPGAFASRASRVSSGTSSRSARATYAAS